MPSQITCNIFQEEINSRTLRCVNVINFPYMYMASNSNKFLEGEKLLQKAEREINVSRSTCL